MGGQPSLGYDVKERKLIVNEPEAATVRRSFGAISNSGWCAPCETIWRPAAS